MAARMKDRYGKLREPWMTRDVMTLVRKKKEAHVTSKRTGTDEALEERSCLTNLIEIFEEVTKTIEEKAVDVVYVDFSKAFIEGPHGGLVQKVKPHAIRGELARWIQNWLSYRKQRLLVEEYFSDWRVVMNGFPQGSVRGPLLFMVYINDLGENIAGLISMFADDTKIGGVADIEENCQRIQQDVENLKAWAERWQMAFNPDKCEVMHFGRSRTCGNYTVNGRTLSGIDIQRELGMRVQQITEGDSVVKVVKKAYGMLALIGRGIEYKDRLVMLQLYRTLVRPHLEYCVQFWSPHYQKDVDA
eukprot:g31281.t1